MTKEEFLNDPEAVALFEEVKKSNEEHRPMRFRPPKELATAIMHEIPNEWLEEMRVKVGMHGGEHCAHLQRRCTV